MHHFSTSTYKLLSSSNGIRDVWGIALPKEAYSCDYLMHGLLALSALHLDSLNQGQSNYESLSTYHFHKCLTRFIDGLAHISTENCVSLFGLSSLIVVHVCGQSVRDVCPPSSRGNSASAIEKVLGIFNMCRGVETILAPYWAQIQQSSLGSLLHEDYRLIGSRPRYYPPYAQHCLANGN